MSSTLIIGASIPHQTNDTILIVPPTVALAFPERQDLWCTGELYKDHKGRNRGFIGLTKYNKSFETLGTNDIN